MKQKTNRPFLLTGLIMILIVFVIAIVASTMELIASISRMSDSYSQNAILNLVYAILLFANSLAGIVCIIISIIRWNVPIQVFIYKIESMIATICFGVILDSVIVFGLIQYFDVYILMLDIFLFISLVFIILGMCLKPKIKNNGIKNNSWQNNNWQNNGWQDNNIQNNGWQNNGWQDNNIQNNGWQNNNMQDNNIQDNNMKNNNYFDNNKM